MRWTLNLSILILLPQALLGTTEDSLKNDGALLEIALDSSRAAPSAGSGLGITATLHNLSTQKTLYLSETSVVLTLPPELAGGQNPSFYASFATEPSCTALSQPVGCGQISLRPGASYTTFWVTNSFERARDVSKDSRSQAEDDSLKTRAGDLVDSLLREILWEFRFILFTPGDYKVAVQAKYSLATPADGPPPYYAVSQSKTLSVVVPQFVILLGASIGGLLGYLMLPQARKWAQAAMAERERSHYLIGPRWARSIARQIAGVTAACLLSAIVTILLSRLAEAHFLVSITVNDVWGAIAIGFVANYVGVRLLESLMLRPSNDSADQNKNAVPSHNPSTPATRTTPA